MENVISDGKFFKDVKKNYEHLSLFFKTYTCFFEISLFLN